MALQECEYKHGGEQHAAQRLKHKGKSPMNKKAKHNVDTGDLLIQSRLEESNQNNHLSAKRAMSTSESTVRFESQIRIQITQLQT
jgi:hypothetical protein